MHTRIDLFVNIVTQSSVPPDGRDCTRDLRPSVGDDQQANQRKWHTLVYSLADNVRLFFRAGRALGVYGSMMVKRVNQTRKCEKTVRLRYVAVQELCFSPITKSAEV
jgi:hypothetical protein